VHFSTDRSAATREQNVTLDGSVDPKMRKDVSFGLRSNTITNQRNTVVTAAALGGLSPISSLYF